MCNRILETRGSFRAFYIVLLMLQQMQKLNGNRKIKDLKVWTQELVHLCEAKTRRMEQASWSNGTRIAGMLGCEPSMRMDFSLAPNRREVRRPKVRKLIRMKCCILSDSCIFFDRLKRSLNSVWPVSAISSPWRRTFDAKCATLSCWTTPAYACRLELLDSSPSTLNKGRRMLM